MPAQHAGEWGYGDVWTWVAIDADSKLVPSWAVGRRDGFTAQTLIKVDLAAIVCFTKHTFASQSIAVYHGAL